MRKKIDSKTKPYLLDYKLFGDIYIFFNFKQNQNINLKKIISFMETNIPKLLFKNVDAIYVSSFSKLKNQGLDGLENEGAIYITDDFSSDKELLKKILHEVTHAFVGENIPESISKEFSFKKAALVSKIKSVFNLNSFTAMGEDYQKFLEVNIQAINLIIKNLFVSPYASVNEKEYIASGVEVYFQESKTWLKENCPKLFEFVENIVIENMELNNGSY